MKYLKIILILFIILTAVVLVRNAWVCDDAYISFRVIDNFIHGYGLRWNIAERVQVYTHPLWLFFLSLFYFFTKEIFITSIVISIILVLISIYLVTYKISNDTSLSLLAVTILCFSKAFIDFSTSGLENPATFLLLAIFFSVFINERSDPKKLLILSFIASLGVLNRMDSLLLFFPALSYDFYKCLKFKFKLLNSFRSVIIGFMPFILWEIFSIIYYGFPFPNTAYAKLNTGVPSGVLIEKGLLYLGSSFYGRQDIVTPVVIVLGIFAAFFIKDKKVKYIACGIILYLLYVVKIGGDFMIGRFLSASLFCSVIIISRLDIYKRKTVIILAMVFVLVMGLISPKNPLVSGSQYKTEYIKDMQVVDERGYYYQGSSFLKALKGENMPSFFTVEQGKLIKLKQADYISSKIIGFLGYYAGPIVYIVDPYALSDPLLARLPIPTYDKVKPGHYERLFPEGYLRTISEGQNYIVDQDLAKYYDELLLITRGSLFDGKRFISILKINTGQFDHLINEYKSNFDFY